MARKVMSGGFPYTDNMIGDIVFWVSAIIVIVGIVMLSLWAAGVLTPKTNSPSDPRFSQSNSGVLAPQIGPGGTNTNTVLVTINYATSTNDIVKQTSDLELAYALTDIHTCTTCSAININVNVDGQTIFNKRFPLNSTKQSITLPQTISASQNANVTVAVVENGSDSHVASQTVPIDVL